jgi:hypothetical protein
MQSVWAVMCGLIRDEAAALKKVESLSRLCRDGLIDGVVCSSWFKDYEQYPAVMRAISEAGFILVESEQPRLKLRGFAFHQSKSIHMALEFVPDDALVLRVRPDLGSTDNLFELLVALRSGELSLRKPISGVYHSAVFAHSCHISSPLYVNDIILMAVKTDLKQIFHFDYRAEFFGCNLAPEQFFYFRCFCERFRLFELFFRVNPGLVFGDRELSQQLLRAQLDTDFFMDVFALYLLVLDDCFDVGFKPPKRLDEGTIATELSKQSLFSLLSTPDPATGLLSHAGSNAAVCHRKEAIRGILDGRMIADKDAERLATAVSRARGWLHGAAEPSHMDYNEALAKYIEAVTKLVPVNPRFPKQVGPNRFGYWGADRAEVIGADETYQRMEAELNVLRRTVDELRRNTMIEN